VAKQDDPDVVRAEYASETGLLTRISLYANARGDNANDVVVEKLLDGPRGSVLEVGCGPGTLAKRLREDHDVSLYAIDLSERMVDLARGLGVNARVGDVQALPFADASFDCVIAAWMLYHVPDLDLGLREIRRVLRPGGRLIAVTNSERHLVELWQQVGRDRYELPFNAENGQSILQRHFASVERCDVEGTVTIVDRETAREYIAASIKAPELADRFPELEQPLHATSRNCVLIAR